MGQKLKILLVSSEVAPFAKTGGLADVTGALPKAIQKLGHDIRVLLPYYRMVKLGQFKTEEVVRELKVPISNRIETSAVRQTHIATPAGKVPVYLLENDKYYDRKELYSTPKGDYEDNAERFIYFSRAALEMLKAIDFRPDVIHCNDWQAGLIPIYLKSIYLYDPFFKNTASVFTIHNLAYQGKFWHFDMHLTGLGWEYFIPDWIEFYGKINLLKAGILHTDLVSTVSKTYSQEIQTPEYGCGLEGVLRARASDLHGIVNGLDYEVTDPSIDKYLKDHYDARNPEGKHKNKVELQKRFQLPQKDVPILGMIGRLDAQKGWDLISYIIEDLMKLDLQMVVLGSGAEEYEKILREKAEKYPQKIGLRVAFDPALAQLIYAGSDMFIMPSKFEPCGLGQLISLRYGTIPIVRATGGLADTIKDYNPKTGAGNGFVFKEYSGKELLATVKRALEVYKDQPTWRELIINGMQQDFSWTNSAKEYIKLYQKAIEKHG